VVSNTIKKLFDFTWTRWELTSLSQLPYLDFRNKGIEMQGKDAVENKTKVR